MPGIFLPVVFSQPSIDEREKMANIHKAILNFEEHVTLKTQRSYWKERRITWRKEVCAEVQCSERLFHLIWELENSVQDKYKSPEWKTYEQQIIKSLYLGHQEKVVEKTYTYTQLALFVHNIECAILDDAKHPSWKENRNNIFLHLLDSVVDILELCLQVSDVVHQLGCMIRYHYTSSENFNGEVTNAVNTFKEKAEDLEKITRDVGISKTVGGSVTVAGGVGLIAAPFTAGLSLIFVGVGVLGSLTTLGAGFTKELLIKKIREECENAFETLKVVCGIYTLLRHFLSYVDIISHALENQQIEAIVRQLTSLTQLSNSSNIRETALLRGLVKNILKMNDLVRVVIVLGTIRPTIVSPENVVMINSVVAGGMESPGKFLGIQLTKSGKNIPLPLIGKAGSMGARIFGSTVGIVLGSWDIVNGLKDIFNSPQMAKDFNDCAAALETMRSQISENWPCIMS
eukprot:TRINITY_DN111_c0_g1_i19.p1 TRINITY_DN111_c0_g1~~TRINITY_DN111_c0_g1_i19.p1  ORF type:complete len:458 (+),score=25.63 TRINITY_DN111_c0_g1_i19:273-1646(+)